MTTQAQRRPRRDQISEAGQRKIMQAIAIGLIAIIPSVVLAVLLWREVDQRSNANRQLILRIEHNAQQQEKVRADVRKAIREADIENCQEDEVVKAKLRSLLAFDPAELKLTLEQLGIDPQSPQGIKLADRSRVASAEAVKKLGPRDCSKLPDPTVPQP